MDLLRQIMTEMVEVEKHQTELPVIMLVVGVNGVGKTTTIAKLAQKYKDQGKKVMVAAATPSEPPRPNSWTCGLTAWVWTLSRVCKERTLHPSSLTPSAPHGPGAQISCSATLPGACTTRLT